MMRERRELCIPHGRNGNVSGRSGAGSGAHRRPRVSLHSLMAIAAALAIGAGCAGGDDDEDTTTTSADTTQISADPISVGELLDREAQGSPGDTVMVAAVLVDDGSGMLMCEALAESFPPQCGGRSIGVRNPEGVDVPLTEEQGVRWTDRAIWMVGWVEDGVFVVT